MADTQQQNESEINAKTLIGIITSSQLFVIPALVGMFQYQLHEINSIILMIILGIDVIGSLLSVTLLLFRVLKKNSVPPRHHPCKYEEQKNENIQSTDQT